MNTKDQYFEYVNLISKKNFDIDINELNFFIQSKRNEILKILDNNNSLKSTIKLTNILLGVRKYHLLVIFLELLSVKLFNDFQVRYYLASAFYEIKQYPQAEYHLKIIPNDKLDVHHYKLFANIYYGSEEYLKCVNTIIELRKIDKIDIINTTLIFNCYIRLRRIKDLEKEEINFERLKISESEMFNVKIQIYLAKNLFFKALKKIETNINRYVNNYKILETYSLVLRKFNRLDESIKYLEIAKKLEKKFDYSGHVYSLHLANKSYEKGFSFLSETSEVPAIVNFFTKNNVYKWQGEALDERIIFIYSGSGVAIGDNIFYFRYLIDLINKYSKLKVYFCLNKMNLKYLFNNSGVEVIDINLLDKYFTTKKISFYSSIPNLAEKYCKENGNKIINFIRFIPASSTKSVSWFNILKNYKTKIKVGLNWKGNVKYKYDMFRSLKIEDLEVLLKIPDVLFFVLNPNITYKEEMFISNNKNVILIDRDLTIDEKENAYIDTIEIMKNMDLIVTSDTSTAHISAALQLKTYLMLEYSPSWYWNNSEINNIYQNDELKFFKQTEPGNWQSVIYKLRNNITNSL